MQNLTIKINEDECPPLTETDFQKMRRYPVKKIITLNPLKKDSLENISKPNSHLELNRLAS
jgi:hypothetical protein